MLAHWWAELTPRVTGCRAQCPRADFELLVGEAKAQDVLGLVLAGWWLELGPRISGCQALGVLRLVLAHCCMVLGPGPSGGQDHVLRCLGLRRS